jgi:hypothetical protein
MESMKPPQLFSLLLIICLAACSSSSPDVTPTATAGMATPTANAATVTATEQASPSPTIPPTETLAPTPTVPDIYPGIAPTQEQLPLWQVTDIPAIIAKLRQGPSLLSANATAPKISTFGEGTDNSGYLLDCNEGGMINCAFAASGKVMKDSTEGDIVIAEVKNADGTRGYMPLLVNEGKGFMGIYKNLLARPLGPMGIFLDITYISAFPAENQIRYALLKQEGIIDAIIKYSQTGIVQPLMEQDIIEGHPSIY